MRLAPGSSRSSPRAISSGAVSFCDYGSYDEYSDGQALQVVVCQHRGQLFGFVVSQVLDIVEDELAIRTHLDTGGNLGSAVVNEHVTELLNIDNALAGMIAPDAADYAGGGYSGAYAASGY